MQLIYPTPWLPHYSLSYSIRPCPPGHLSPAQVVTPQSLSLPRTTSLQNLNTPLFDHHPLSLQFTDSNSPNSQRPRDIDPITFYFSIFMFLIPCMFLLPSFLVQAPWANHSLAGYIQPHLQNNSAEPNEGGCTTWPSDPIARQKIQRSSMYSY